MKKYKTYFVTCSENGEGVQIHTDLNFDLKRDDLLIQKQKH